MPTLKTIIWRIKEEARKAKLSVFGQTKEMVVAKNNDAIAFWVDRFATRGGKDAWRKLYVELYCHYLEVDQNSFTGKVVVDIGCGPHGAAGWFNTKLTFGIDPLANRYHQAFDLLQDNMIYLSTGAENIPLVDDFADVVISRNALDHVDDLNATIKEIHRILKPGGQLRAAINYQNAPTTSEPIVIRDTTIQTLLGKQFSYEILKRYPSMYDSGIGELGLFQYPHPVILVNAIKQ